MLDISTIMRKYAAGASEVMVKWSDTFTSRQFLEFANQERLENIPDYLVKEAEYIADNKAARISVISEDPDAFNGLDHNRVSTFQKANGKALNVVNVKVSPFNLIVKSSPFSNLIDEPSLFTVTSSNLSRKLIRKL